MDKSFDEGVWCLAKCSAAKGHDNTKQPDLRCQQSMWTENKSYNLN